MNYNDLALLAMMQDDWTYEKHCEIVALWEQERKENGYDKELALIAYETDKLVKEVL